MTDGNNVDNESFDFLSTTKILLGIKDNEIDEILLMYIELIRNEILNYCNISELPSVLFFTVCQMAANVYQDNINKNSTGKTVGNISSISEDGRTVSFSTDVKTEIEDRITRTTELKRYRKLYRI